MAKQKLKPWLRLCGHLTMAKTKRAHKKPCEYCGKTRAEAEHAWEVMMGLHGYTGSAAEKEDRNERSRHH